MKLKIAVLAALAPGWIIPRIVGTLAFIAAPSLVGLVGLLAWWLLVPVGWWLIWRIVGFIRRERLHG